MICFRGALPNFLAVQAFSTRQLIGLLGATPTWRGILLRWTFCDFPLRGAVFQWAWTIR